MDTNYVCVISPNSDCSMVGVIGFSDNKELNAKLASALNGHFCEEVTFDPIVREFKKMDVDGISINAHFGDGSETEIYLEPTVLY